MKEVDDCNEISNLINFDENCFLSKEENPNEDQNFFNKVKPNKGLNIISERFCFDYFGAKLNPDYVLNDVYYFFFPNSFITELETMLNDSLNKYPNTFQPIKDDLLKFSKEKQEKEFKKKIGSFAALKRKVSVFFSEKNSKNERIKAKKVAFLLSQLNGQKRETNNNIYIVYLNKNDSKLYFDSNPILKNICDDFSFDTFKNDYNKIILDLSLKIKRFNDNIINNSYFNYKDKCIYINYMILIINKEIREIEYSYKFESLNEETKEKLRKIRNTIDSLALEYRLKFVSNVKFFYDIEFEVIKIIKDNEEEKKAFIDKGNNLDSFIYSFKKEFDNIKKKTKPIDENEDIYDFDKKCWKNINTLKNEKKNILCEDNNNSNDSRNISIVSINITKDPKMNRFDLIDINEQITYWEKLRIINMLLNEIDKITREKKNYFGLIISQKKNDIFNVDIVY